MKRVVTSLIAAAGLSLLIVPAQAAPIEREKYSGTDEFTFKDCGFEVHNTVTFEGTFMLKAPRTEGGPPYLFDNYRAVETLTTTDPTANGRTLTIEHQGLYKDLKVEHVEGTTYQFVAMESGRPVTVRDDQGNVLFRDRGMLRTTFTVDTQGDTVLKNDVHIDGSFELLADRGRHPFRYVDYCDFLADYFDVDLQR